MTPDEAVTYVQQSVAWALLGFGIGIGVGELVRRESPKHAIARTLLGLTMIAITVWVVYSERQTNVCQREQFSAGLRERTEAAAIERKANQIRWRSMESLLATPIDRLPDLAQERENRARVLADLREANQLIAEADAKRAAAPPTDPSRSCS